MVDIRGFAMTAGSTPSFFCRYGQHTSDDLCKHNDEHDRKADNGGNGERYTVVVQKYSVH